MALEIERKFLVHKELLPDASSTIKMEQGYIPSEPLIAVRVRIENDIAKLAVKAKKSELTRYEYEYEIPMADAQEMLNNICEQPTIKKVRHLIPIDHHTWEVDIFEGENKGLIVAEVELSSETEAVTLPHWIRKEVTPLKEYRNNFLSKHPFNTWDNEY